MAAASLLAVLIAAAALRAGTLTRSGALAATAIGAVCLTSDMLTRGRWSAYLLLWFASASLLSRMGRRRKLEHAGGIIEKPDARGAWQVIANGAVFTFAVAAAHVSAGSAAGSAAVAAAAALAAAGADTWATEVGTWVRSDAWSLRTATRVPAGTSGAVTPSGTLALLLGSATYAALAATLGLVPASTWPAVLLGAVAGATADTVLGAWWQERRYCATCRTATEQRQHRCGTATSAIGGVHGFRNDAVNLAATLSGAVVAVLVAAALAR